MSSQSHDHHVDTVLDFCFDDSYPVTRWFLKDDALDEEIKTKFSELVAKARTSELDSWCSTPKGTLALIILLDQFSRNVYRGQPDSFIGDAKARNLTCIAIAKGFDRQVPLIQQIFMYLPFMHHEDLLGQIAGKSLCEGMIARCDMGTKELDFAKSATDSAQKHIDVILEFGRFPARNAAMGRKSTPEEEVFLGQYPMGIKP